MIKLLLVEDQAMVRGALSALLTMSGKVSVTEASNGGEAQGLLTTGQFDVVLTDIEMPVCSGLELLQWVRAQELPVKVVILTTFGRSGYIQRALRGGVDGFLLKDAEVDSLLRSLDKIIKGQKVIEPELAMLALGETDPLTDKERRALRLASEGKSTSDIARELFIAEGTARNYLSECIAKLGASNRIEAARIAQQKGWL